MRSLNLKTLLYKGIKFKDNSKVISNFFDKKFRIGSWTEYDDFFRDIIIL
jgi:hypothetical protein